MSVSEFPGRVVGTPIEPPSALPEGSSIACECLSKGRRMRRIKPPYFGTVSLATESAARASVEQITVFIHRSFNGQREFHACLRWLVGNSDSTLSLPDCDAVEDGRGQ